MKPKILHAKYFLIVFVSLFFFHNTSKAQSITIFDPETFDSGDLPAGMEIVEQNGYANLQVVLNGWNSVLYIPEITLDSGMVATCNFKFLLGDVTASTYSMGDMMGGVQLMDTINKVDNPWGSGVIPSATGMVQDTVTGSWEWSPTDVDNAMHYVHQIQFFGQNKVDWGATIGDTILVGKIEAKKYPPHAEVCKTEIAPVIDGTEDAVWANAEAHPIELNYRLQSPTVDAYWKATWCDSGMFVLVNVQDNDHWPSFEAGGNPWEYDLCEVYFDVNENLNDGLGAADGAGHYQSAPAFESGKYGIELTDGTTNNNPGSVYAYQLTGENYVKEHFFYFENFKNGWGVSLDRDDFLDRIQIGFDVRLVDQDEGITSSAHNKVWHNFGIESGNWYNMDNAGTIALVEGPTNTSDSLALIALYNSTNGDNWVHKTNWLTGHVDTWYGITVESGRVVEIDLGPNNNLQGTIPSDIGNLTELRLLNLCASNLTGTIPTTLWDLTNLLELDLTINQLEGVIPSDIENLTSLVRLKLQQNQFSGSMPVEVGNLSNLEDLDLAFNEFTGNIPASIGGLLNLSNLNLQSNQLSGSIPSEVGGLTNLNSIWLSDNQLTGNIPSQIGNCTSLTVLALDDNFLTGNIPPEIGNCTNLTRLTMSNNQLSGEVPSVFENLNNLNLCYLQYNQLSGDLPSLTINARLYTEENRFVFSNIEASGCLPGQGYDFTYSPQDTILAIEQGGSSLTVIDGGATNNQYAWYKDEILLTSDTRTITNEGKGAYRVEITNTDYPDLTLNSEVYFYYDTPFEADSLALVALYNTTDGDGWTNNSNWLTGTLDTWYGVTVESDRVTRLEIPDNNLNGQLVSQLEYLTGLVVLNLANNSQLSGVIPDEMGGLISLEEFRLYNTQIGGTIPSSLANLSNLIILNLGWNNFSEGTLPDLSGATNLREIYMGNSNLTGGIPSWLLTMPNLQNLTIDNNNFTPGLMPDFSNLPNLVELNLYNCNFNGNIPSSLLEMDQLYYLTLGGNEFNEGPLPDFSGMPNLQLLNMHNCNFTGVINSSICTLTSLWKLDLGSNKLSGNIPDAIGNLTNVINLNLSHNQFTGNIPAGLGNMSQVYEIYINGNQFSGNLPAELGNCGQLHVFRLEDNRFQHIDIESVFNWTNYGQFTDFVYAPQKKVGVEQMHCMPEGKNVVFTIDDYQISSNDTYQWYKDGIAVPDSTNLTYTISNTEASDAGEYYCLINNSVTTGLTLHAETITLFVGSIGLTGDFNDWGNTPDLPLIQNSENSQQWSVNYVFDTYNDVKFRINNNWINNWGGDTFPSGEAASYGSNINVPAGYYQIDFNFDNMEYNFINADSMSLVAFYNSTGGTSWNNKQNWLTGPLDTWHGVNVENGRVTELDLGWANNLNGTLPSEIGNLTALKRFIINGNDGLTGSIPSSIGNLVNLETLIFYNNNLTGSIPSTFSNAAYIREFDFNNNQLSGSLPDLSGLTQLNTFRVQDNKFTFANLSATGIEVGNINEFVYAPQDTLLAIQQDGSSLTALDCGDENNQINWYHNGTLVTENSQTCNAAESGYYNYVVTNSVYTDLSLYSDTLEVETGDVPVDRQVSNYSLSDGNSDCLDAQNEITVAGDGTQVTVQSGASTTFIAGHSIRFRSGFHAQAGSYVDAHITTTGSFCDNLPAAPMMAAEPVADKSAELENTEPEKKTFERQSMKVYPNPNNGRFTIKLENIENETRVLMYSTIGQKVYDVTMTEQLHTVELPIVQRGIYFIKAINNQKQFDQKIVIQ